MLPAALTSTYQQYKKDTDSIAAWLASTAKSAGFSFDHLSSASNGAKQPGSGGRAKGKARTQAKKLAAKAAARTTAAPSRGPKHIIGIKDFIVLAEHLAKKSVTAPASFRIILDRVIAARSNFGTRLEDCGDILNKKQDAQHIHFVDVLKKVRHTLSPLMPSDNNKGTGTISDDLNNRFAGLAVYEPSDKFLNAPDVERPKQTSEDNAHYEAEVPTSLEDAIFAFTTLINDMNRMRSRIEWIWSNYADGIFDLAAAAIATDTAIGLVRNMIDDILPLLNLHGGTHEILHMFYWAQCKYKGFKESQMRNISNPEDDFNYDTYDVASGTYLMAFRLLELFVNVIEPGELPLYKEGMFGFYDPKSDRSRKTGLQKFHDDRALIMPFFTELMTVILVTPDWPVHDEFLRGIKELKETKTVPLCTVFCAQVFLDISYQLGEMVEQPCVAMMKQLSFISADIQDHLDFHKNLKIANWPAENDKNLRRVQESIQWLKKDPLIQAQNRHLRRAGVAPLENPLRIFRMSPVMSGLTLYYFRCLYRDIGLHVANSWGSIQYCEHLYNMLRHNARLTAPWVDMDIVKTLLGAEDNFYVGGATPKTLPDQLKMYCLQMGVSAATLANRKRKGAPIVSKTGPRSIEHESVAPVHGMFERHYIANTTLLITPEHLNRIIELRKFEQEAEEGDGCIMGQIEDPQILKEKKKLRQQAHQAIGPKNRPNGPLVAPEQLVKLLVMALNAEKMELSYPYLHFHRRCWGLLRAVKEKCDGTLRQMIGSAYLETENQLAFIVGYILMMACESTTLPMEQATEAMQEMVESGNGSFTTTKLLGDVLGMPVSIVSE